MVVEQCTFNVAGDLTMYIKACFFVNREGVPKVTSGLFSQVLVNYIVGRDEYGQW